MAENRALRERHVEELRSLRGEIHLGLAAAFLAAADGLESRMLALPDASPEKTPEGASDAQRAVDAAAADGTSALAAWLRRLVSEPAAHLRNGGPAPAARRRDRALAIVIPPGRAWGVAGRGGALATLWRVCDLR